LISARKGTDPPLEVRELHTLRLIARAKSLQQRNLCTDYKSAQQCTTRGHPYHSPKLHPGPCSSVGMRRWTDTHTQTAVTNIHFASSTTHAKCNEYPAASVAHRRGHQAISPLPLSPRPSGCCRVGVIFVTCMALLNNVVGFCEMTPACSATSHKSQIPLRYPGRRQAEAGRRPASSCSLAR